MGLRGRSPAGRGEGGGRVQKLRSPPTFLPNKLVISGHVQGCPRRTRGITLSVRKQKGFLRSPVRRKLPEPGCGGSGRKGQAMAGRPPHPSSSRAAEAPKPQGDPGEQVGAPRRGISLPVSPPCQAAFLGFSLPLWLQRWPKARTGPRSGAGGEGPLQPCSCFLSPPHHPAQGPPTHPATNSTPFYSSWLLQDSGMRLRTTYKGFTEAVDLYFDHLMARVVPLQVKAGSALSHLPPSWEAMVPGEPAPRGRDLWAEALWAVGARTWS